MGYTFAVTRDALNGCLAGSPDKSISHRAFLFSALASGTSRIRQPLLSEDVLATIKICNAFGALCEPDDHSDPATAYTVTGAGLGNLAQPNHPLFCGNSGTLARLLFGIAAVHPLDLVLTGDDSLSARPMRRIVSLLENNGAEFLLREDNFLPASIRGRPPAAPYDVTLPVASAQLKTAVMLAALAAPGISVIHEPVASRDHTERMLPLYGAKLERHDSRICLHGQPDLRATAITVPADPSSAAFPLAAASLIPHSCVTVTDVCVNPLRTGFLQCLKEMGADLTLTPQAESFEPIARLTLCYAPLQGITVPVSRVSSMIDEFPIFAIVAASAHGETICSGLQELKIKESNRLERIVNGLKSCGVPIESRDSWLRIEGLGGQCLRGNVLIKTHADHRIAMAFLMANLIADEQVYVDDISSIKTSYPRFFADMSELGCQLQSTRS